MAANVRRLCHRHHQCCLVQGRSAQCPSQPDEAGCCRLGCRNVCCVWETGCANFSARSEQCKLQGWRRSTSSAELAGGRGMLRGRRHLLASQSVTEQWAGVAQGAGRASTRLCRPRGADLLPPVTVPAPFGDPIRPLSIIHRVCSAWCAVCGPYTVQWWALNASLMPSVPSL